MPAEDFWMMRADRRWVCLNLLSNNRLDDPAIEGVVITIRDVTESRNNGRARLSISRGQLGVAAGGFRR